MHRKQLQKAIADLRVKVFDGVILGCTGITLLLVGTHDQPDFINPVQLQAEAAVQIAIDYD